MVILWKSITFAPPINNRKTMELRQLISFVAVAETGTMTNAATRCHLTQSAISQQIKALQEELGTVLFERKPHCILLTESGKIFLKRAKIIVREAQESISEMASIKGELCGELRLGVGSFIEPYIRHAAVEFMKRYPNVLLHVQFDHANVLNKMLRDEEIDLAFTMNIAYHNEGIESSPCIPFKLSAIMSKRNKFADKEKLTFEDLAECKIIMPDVGERVFNSIQRYTQNDISKLPVMAIVSNPSAVLMVLDELDAITFLPSDYTITSHKLIAKPIETLEMELMSNAHWLKDKPLKASAKEFLNVINEFVK